MNKPFLEYDLADFSNTNDEQKTLAEIRRDAYTEGFMCGKAEGRADERAKIINELHEWAESQTMWEEYEKDTLFTHLEYLMLPQETREQIKEKDND